MRRRVVGALLAVVGVLGGSGLALVGHAPAADDMVVGVTTTGSPTQLLVAYAPVSTCPASARVEETDSQVLVRVDQEACFYRRTLGETFGGPWEPPTLRVTLSAPLGGRTVVGADQHEVAVLDP